MTAAASLNAARLADARAHLDAARAPGAAGPGPDAPALRRAYLDLLKLCLCDLVGTTTMSVGAMEGGAVLARELGDDQRKLRAAGMDWPLHGLTMVGLERLDDLQACVESVVADGIEGDLVEAGSWRGGASILMRATLDCLGEDRTVWVADSFQGFPDDTPPDDGSPDLRAFDFLAVPVEEVRSSFARLGVGAGVQFVPGFFDRTLPALAGRRWALVRLDADSYDATRLALECLYPGLSRGGYLVVDDYGSFEGCRRAVDEFRAEHGIDAPIERIDSTGARWRRADEAAAERPAPEPPPAAPPPEPAPAVGDRHVPTVREAELAREVEALRTRLAAAEAQIGVRAWARRRLGRDGGAR